MAQFVQEYDPLVRMEQPSYLTTLHSQSYDSWEEFSAPFQVRNFFFFLDHHNHLPKIREFILFKNFVLLHLIYLG